MNYFLRIDENTWSIQEINSNITNIEKVCIIEKGEVKSGNFRIKRINY